MLSTILALPLAALLLQADPARQQSADTAARRAARDTLRPRHVIRRIPVTPEHLATAFEDARARTLLLDAREARLRQDSALTAYEAKAHQRVTLGMGFKVIGRDRLFMRHEAVTRVRWHRDAGAVVDVIGSRYVIPPASGATATIDDTEIPGVPYYPGRDDLWFGVPASLAEGEDAVLIHPIAAGAEAYYRYAVGDSASFRLPDGSTIRLIELRVRPREPSWRLAVGSLWFDASTAQLVRAVYRLATPMDASWAVQFDGQGRVATGVLRTMLSPIRATLESVVIEHGLHEGRFWLPRAQTAEGEVELSFARLPMKVEERFEYASVNDSFDSLPEIPQRSAYALDSLRADSLGLTGRERRRWLNEQFRTRLQAYKQACDGGVAERTMSHSQFSRMLPVLVRVPCDTVALMSSAELPASIFEPGEALFTREDLQDVQRLLGLGAQAAFAPQRPSWFAGPAHGLLRYNRVEGLSAGAGIRSELGRGFAVEARAQIGTADREPNGEIRLERSDGSRTLRLGAYRRLVASNDWGTPLGFGASLDAFLFGRDEGFYYRTVGAEVSALGSRESRLEWSLFAERHDDAARSTHFSLPHALHGLDFHENIVADEAGLVGVRSRISRSFGVDPRRLRLFGDLRLEGASGDFTFVRGALDLTVLRALSERLEAAVTAGAGSSAGAVPVQRLYFLGGTQTIRGQTPGAGVGDAYWMGRGELGIRLEAARPSVFYDVGWAGSRGEWREPGRPMSGAGIGLSLLDGLIRLDLARGISPRQRWTASLRLDAVF